MALPGLEPGTLALLAQCSNRLSYKAKCKLIEGEEEELKVTVLYRINITSIVANHNSTVIQLMMKKAKATPRVELGLSDSESDVITTTLRRLTLIGAT